MAELPEISVMSEDVKGDVPPTTPEKPAAPGVEGSQTLKIEDVQKIVQSETDKVRTELHQKLKAKETEIETLKKSQMSEKELREYKEKQLQEKERELLQKELVIVATDSLKDSGLPIEFREFVISDNAETTKTRVLALKETFQKAVEAAVQDKFKSAGHDPKKGDPPKTSTFTRADLLKMSPQELAKSGKLAEIQEALARGQIK